MTPRFLIPLAIAGLFSAGCSHAVPTASAATPPQTPAPFATPPVVGNMPDVATLVSKVNSEVVNITAIHEVKGPRLSNFFSMDPFNGGFGGPFGHMPQGDDEPSAKEQALGSGFIVDSSGLVATNAHVVDDADQVRVNLADGRSFNAKVKGRDKQLDLAVLQLEGAKDLSPVALGSSNELRVGEYVVAIGNPFGLGGTVTMGIVSAKGRAISPNPYSDDFIQTDASINPGNSGGPLFNLRGQVIGINTAINPQGKGIGFAVPIDALKQVMPQLLATGHVERGKLGVAVQGVDESLAKALNLNGTKGALVGDVEKGGPGDRAGLQPGDVIVGVDGEEVASSRDLPHIIAHHTPGSKVALHVLRDHHDRTVDVTLGALKADKSDASGGDETSKSDHRGRLGALISNADGGGALIQRVDPNGNSAGKLLPGDVVTEVNHKKITGARELTQAVQSARSGDPILLRVERSGASIFVAIG